MLAMNELPPMNGLPLRDRLSQSRKWNSAAASARGYSSRAVGYLPCSAATAVAVMAAADWLALRRQGSRRLGFLLEPSRTKGRLKVIVIDGGIRSGAGDLELGLELNFDFDLVLNWSCLPIHCD